MIITIGDAERLKFAFEKRIDELGKLAFDNPDIRKETDLKIQEYQRTLNKYRSINGNED